jgi:protein-disulfide isomerase
VLASDSQLKETIDEVRTPAGAVVAEDHRDALAHGVNGTPTFFVNGRMLVGAQQLAAFEALLTD